MMRQTLHVVNTEGTAEETYNVGITGFLALNQASQYVSTQSSLQVAAFPVMSRLDFLVLNKEALESEIKDM
jgi:hypothetical protein